MPEIIFNGPAGRLEARYHHSKIQNAPLALCLHPSPEHGGTMNNKIAYRMYSSFARAGFSVLRFNFRGVGRSMGKCDDGIGEMTDAASALDWIQLQNPDASQCWIAGFSFGAWISLQLLMRRPEIDGFIAVSPPANHYDLSFLAPCPASGLIVHGTRDNVVPEPDVQKLVDRLTAQKGIKITYNKIDGANHFFDKHEADVVETVKEYVSNMMSKPREGR